MTTFFPTLAAGDPYLDMTIAPGDDLPFEYSFMADAGADPVGIVTCSAGSVTADVVSLYTGTADAYFTVTMSADTSVWAPGTYAWVLTVNGDPAGHGTILVTGANLEATI